MIIDKKQRDFAELKASVWDVLKGEEEVDGWQSKAFPRGTYAHVPKKEFPG